MKKLFYSFFLLATGIIVSSCDNSPKSTEIVNNSVKSDSSTVSEELEISSSELSIKPKKVRVQGELGSCFDVVEKSYKLSENDGYSAILSVDIKRNNNPIMFNPAIATTFDSDEGGIAVAFGIVVTDETGKVIHEDVPGEIGHGAPAYPEDAIEVVNLEEGKIGTLNFVISNVDKINNKCTFTITSSYKEI